MIIIYSSYNNLQSNKRYTYQQMSDTKNQVLPESSDIEMKKVESLEIMDTQVIVPRFRIGYYSKSKALFDIFISLLIGVINIVALLDLLQIAHTEVDFQMMELFFFIEMILSFLHGYKDEQGKEVYALGKIAKYYFKT